MFEVKEKKYQPTTRDYSRFIYLTQHRCSNHSCLGLKGYQPKVISEKKKKPKQAGSSPLCYPGLTNI